MIPISLRIKGLYSYQKEQTIDFTRLTEAGLFGIFGSVGSGKSSILEAVTFALYGESERLNAREGRNYNMMNLKSDELIIELIFEAGNPAIRYKALVKSRRNSKQFDIVRTFERTAYIEKDNDWKPVEVSSLPDIIGLSYDNFRRTIIIPQGQFQEFLQLNNRDRTRMLKDLFKLQKYELYDRVADLDRTNNNRLNQITGALEQLGDINLQELQQLKEKIKLLEDEIKEQAVKIEALRKSENQLAAIADMMQSQNQLKGQLELMQKELPAYEKRQQQLKTYQQCYKLFGSLFREEKQLQKTLEDLLQYIAQQNLHITQQKQEEAQLSEQLTVLNTALEKRDIRREEIKELDNMAVWIKNSAELKKRQERIINGTKEVDKVLAQREIIQTKQEQLIQRRAVLRKTLPDNELLLNLQLWLTRQDNLEQQQKELASQIEEHKAALTQNQKEQEALLVHPLLSNTEGTPLQRIKTINQALTKQANDFQHQLTHLKVDEQLGAFSRELHDGSPCPLCGSITHPQVLTMENVQQRLNNLQEQLQRNNHELQQLQNLQRKADQLLDQQTFLKDKEQQFSKRQTELHILQQRENENRPTAKGIVLNHPWLKAQQNLARNISQSLEQLERTETQQRQELRENETKTTKYRDIVELLRSEANQLEGSVDQLAHTFNHINTADYLTIDPLDITRSARAKEVELMQQEKKHEKILQQHTTLISQLAKSEGELTAALRQQHQHIQQQEVMAVQISTTLTNSGYHNRTEVESIMQSTIDEIAEEQHLKQWFDEIANLRAKLSQLESLTQGMQYDLKTHETLKASLIEAETHREELSRTHTHTQRQLEESKKRHQQHIELKREQRTLQKRHENLALLKSLFKASGFVSYVSSIYLQNLVLAANERFYRLTRKHLKLELDAENQFVIRDFMNEGRLRSVKTLSGGQTFQAALSLALALSDNIQQMSKAKQHFFFLDEGFGSLDRESLTIVFQTLKALRQENRIVGVISHVEELQQEIDTWLRVSNDAEKGSQIKSSWQV